VKKQIHKDKKIKTGASLHFDLPEDEYLFKKSLNGTKYHGALEKIDQFLRSQIKYTDNTKIDLEEMRDKLHECCKDEGFDLYED
jgi:hypothetical protein